MTLERPPRKAFLRAALSYRDVRLLVASNAVSILGDWLYTVGLVVYVLEETRSPAWVAAAGFMRLAPHLLFGTIGGAIADRYDRRAAMVVSDLARAGLMLGMAVAAMAGSPAIVLIALAFATSVATTVHDPAAAAIVPSVVAEEDLAAANTVVNIVENVALAAGPAAGGALLLAGKPQLAFALNGGTFVLAALLTRLIRVRPETTPSGPEPSIWKSALDGVKAARSSNDISLILGVYLVVSLLYGQESVLLVLASQRVLGLGPEGAGFLYAAIGAGGLIGAAGAGRIARHTRPGHILGLGLAVSGLSFVGLGLASTPLVGVAVMTLDGVGAVLIEVLAMTMLQRLSPRQVLGRVIGLVDVISVAGGLLGAALAPVLVGVIGLRGALVVGGGVLPLAALVALPKFRQMNDRSAAARARVDEDAAFLGRLDIFSGAPSNVVELVARAAEKTRLGPGIDVIVEGEPADAFYVVRDGGLAVYSSGEGRAAVEIATLGPGSYFGEIGLLERRPRTATVRTSRRSLLYKIGAEDFENILGATGAVRGAIVAGAARRLARTHSSARPSAGE